jgi:hypothetical protein
MAEALALAGAIASVLAAWGGLFLVLVGLGLLFRRACGFPDDMATRRLADFWIGWAGLVAMLQLWHLILPVDWRALTMATLLAIGGWAWNARELRSLRAARRGSPSWGFWIVLLLVAVLLADAAIGPPRNFDSGRYHLASVRWAASYAIVPGLGNLQRQFSLNSPYFLYVAMLDVGPWQQRSQHLANGILLLVLFAQVLLGARTLLAARLRAEPIDVFWLMLLPPVVAEALEQNVASPSPDLPIFALGLVVAGQLTTMLTRPRDGSRSRGFAFLCIAVLTAVGITVKLSFVAFGALATLVAFVMWRTADGGRSRAGHTTLLAAGIAMIVLGSWMIRGIVISGYPAYPIDLGGAPVEWRLPASTLAESRASIEALARLPILGLVAPANRDAWIRDWSWTGRWAWRMLNLEQPRFVMPWLAALVAWGLALYCRWRDPEGRPPGPRRWLFFVAPAVAIVFWFLTAPDPRFVFASVAVLAPATFAFSFERHAPLRRTILAAGASLSCGLTALLLIHGFAWLPAGPDGGFHPPPVARLRTFVTRSGLALHAPESGNECWTGPLTCTISPKVGLRLRQANDFQSGFVLDDVPGGG